MSNISKQKLEGKEIKGQRSQSIEKKHDGVVKNFKNTDVQNHSR